MKRTPALATAALAAVLAAGAVVVPLATTTSSAPSRAASPAVLADLTPARPGALPGELANVASAVGAPAAWSAGLDGRGVGIALIDSGVTPVPGLDTAEAVVPGPDFTTDAADPALRNHDGAGHGTHLAGIIAGRPSALPGARGDFTGIAPGARVISLKVADRHGATDPDDVVAALRWVVQHAEDPGLAIRVVNLAFGLDGVDAAQAAAVQDAVGDAVAAGLVVVAAVGNHGPDAAVSSPASQPGVVAVGATDAAGTVATGDDHVATFSSGGTTRTGAGADLLAPGRSVVSLLAPGAQAGVDNPGSVIEGSLIKGSGTSQATAVVAGAVALLLQERPWLSPAQVEDVLVRSARALPLDPAARVLDVDRARQLTPAGAAPSPGAPVTPLRAPSEGVTWSGVNWSGVNWSGVNWSGVNWSGVNWSGVNWSGVNWSGVNWSGVNWSGVNWSGVNWSGVNWSGVNWSGVNWSGVNWSGVNWSGVNWSGVNWSGVNWSGVNWSGVNWSGVNWSGVNWSGVNWSGVNWSGVNWSGVNWSGVNWSGVNWSGVNWSGVNWSGVNWSGVNWSGVNWS